MPAQLFQLSFNVMRCTLCLSFHPTATPPPTNKRGAEALLFFSLLKGPPSLLSSLGFDLEALSARLRTERSDLKYCLTCWSLIEEGLRHLKEINGILRKLQSILEAAAAVSGSASQVTDKDDGRRFQSRLNAANVAVSASEECREGYLSVKAEPWSIFPDLKEEPEDPEREEDEAFEFAVFPDPLKAEPDDANDNDSAHTVSSRKRKRFVGEQDDDPDYLSFEDMTPRWPKRKVCPLCPKKEVRNPSRCISGSAYLSHLEKEHPDQVLKCRNCEKLLLNSKDILEAHDVAHDQGSLTCSICGLTPTSEAAHYVHLVMVHFVPNKVAGSLECEECQLTFSDGKSFRSHMRNHWYRNTRKEQKQIPCPIPSCEKVLSERYLNKHLVAHDKNASIEKAFKCPACAAAFASEYTLQRHSLTHEDLLPPGRRRIFQCPECLKSFENQEKLEKHSLEEQDCSSGKKKGRLACAAEGCDFLSSSYSDLKKHERRSHPELMVHSCDFCEKTYTTRDFLEAHLVSHGEGPYSCSLCPRKGYPFRDKEEFETHLAIHNGEKTNKCPDCSELFYAQCDLKAHRVKVHNSASKHKCEDCGEFFPTSSLLKEHKNAKHPSSKGVETFPFLTCRKLFPSMRRLKRHLAAVHSERKSSLYCEYCGSKQKDAQFLKLHILRVHERERMEGEKKRVCYFCQKRFLTVFELSCHMWTHTLERPFACHICGKDWNQKHCLTSHLKKHKGDGTFFPKPLDPEELEKEKKFQEVMSQSTTV